MKILSGSRALGLSGLNPFSIQVNENQRSTCAWSSAISWSQSLLNSGQWKSEYLEAGIEKKKVGLNPFSIQVNENVVQFFTH